MSIFTPIVSWFQKEITTFEHSDFLTAAKTEVANLLSEFEPVAEADLKNAAEAIATASLAALAGGSVAAITAGIAAGTTALEQAGHDISSQAINLLATTVVNQISASPALTTNAATPAPAAQ